jgi:hypothetical protein
MTVTTTTTRQSAPRPRGGVVSPNYAPGMETDQNGHALVESWNQSYVGCVLMTYERNGYDDSDFYAVVYDEATDSLKHVEYATTRGYTYDCGATVDATDEVKAKAREVLRRLTLTDLLDNAAMEAKTPEKGKRVRVTKGRKVPLGTEGTVVWKGVDQYANNRLHKTHYRVGLKTDAGETHFTSADNVTVLDPQDYLPDYAALEARAARHAATESWRRN